jgi:predicted DNA-binding transcriptional regulator AlpA
MKLIDFKELKPKKGIKYSRDHLRRKCKAGEFPQPVAISTARIAWVEAEIDEWLADKTRARDQDEASWGDELPVSEMAASDFVGDVVVEPATRGCFLPTEAQPIGPSPPGRSALVVRARGTKPNVPGQTG